MKYHHFWPVSRYNIANCFLKSMHNSFCRGFTVWGFYAFIIRLRIRVPRISLWLNGNQCNNSPWIPLWARALSKLNFLITLPRREKVKWLDVCEWLWDGNVVRGRYRVRDKLASQRDGFFQTVWSQKHKNSYGKISEKDGIKKEKA